MPAQNECPFWTKCVAIVLACAPAWSMPATARTPAEARAYLEGIWLSKRVPDKGDCIAHWYDGETQIEFEFRVSGGRMLVFEPYDLFTAIQIPVVGTSGDEISVTAQSRDGALTQVFRIRPQGSDRMEVGMLQNDGGAAKTEVAYRCGAPNHTVNRGVPMETLRALTPEITGSAALPEAIEGVSDDDICQGRDVGPHGMRQDRGLQFELLGPVHYWIFGSVGSSDRRWIEFDHVRAISQTAPGVLKLEMQEHPGSRDGWDTGIARPTYSLTILIKDKRIEIPELATSLIRCTPPLPGMHRWR
jgi:hypothetical protein